jgi:plastocyanin
MKRLTLLPVVIALSLLLSSCSMHLGLSKLLKGGSSNASNGTPAATTVKTPSAPVSAISIKAGKYRPKNATVKLGSVITWTNNDSVQQSVTSDTPGVFDSGPLAPGATWQHTFAQAGTFPYHSTGGQVYGTLLVVP